MVKISIIIPIYNGEDFIEDSINSILNQTIKDIEVICVNDGSTDNSLKILNKLSKKYNFIKVYNKENEGSGKARNYGIKKAKGKYIAFLDADDYYIDSDALEKMYEWGNTYDANMITGNMMHDNNHENKMLPWNVFKYYKINGTILPEEYGIPWGFYKNLFKKDFLISNNIEFPNLLRGQDPVFLAEILSKIDKIYTVATDFYAYWYNNDIKKANTRKKLLDQYYHYKYVFKHLEDSKFEDIRKEYKYKLFLYSDRLGNENAIEGLSCLKEVFKEDDDFLRDLENYFYLKYSEQFKEIFHQPILSIIIPIYKSKDYLKDSLNNILNQININIEIICIDYCYEDDKNSLNYVKENNNVKLIYKKNKNFNDLITTSLEHSNGTYIYFFDLNYPISLKNIEEIIKTNIITSSDLTLFYDGLTKIQNIIKGFKFNYCYFNYIDIEKHIFDLSIYLNSKIYKKNFLMNINEKFNNNIEFQIKTISSASKISYIEKDFFKSKQKHSLIEKSSFNTDLLEVFNNIESSLKKENSYDNIKNNFLIFKINYLTYALILKNSEKFYYDVKEEFLNMYLPNIIFLSDNSLKKLLIVLKSTSLEMYKQYYFTININNLEKKNKKIKKKTKDLINENKKLKKQNKKLKKQNKEMKTSNSWKITKPLRKIGQLKN